MAQDESPAGPQLPESSRTPLLRKVESSINRGAKVSAGAAESGRKLGRSQSRHRRARRHDGAGHACVDQLRRIASVQTTPVCDQIPATTRAVGQQNTYAIGLRACVWASLPEPIRANNLKADLGWLMNTQIKKGANEGMYAYSGYGIGDFSNSQYGVLGVWYAAMTRARSADRILEAASRRSGGSINLPTAAGDTCPSAGASYASMTAAGAATLYITNDYLHAADAQRSGRPGHEQAARQRDELARQRTSRSISTSDATRRRQQDSGGPKTMTASMLGGLNSARARTARGCTTCSSATSASAKRAA